MKPTKLIIIALFSLIFASCVKEPTPTPVTPTQQEQVEVTSVLKTFYQNDPNHVTKIRLCIKNNSLKTLYYCKINIVIYDDSIEVYRKTIEVGSKDNYYWTIGPNETQWSDYYPTDFYSFGDDSFSAKVIEPLFY